MATISTVNGKKITKIKYKGEIFDTGGSKNEPITITANGVYTAPNGVGYSPVSVSVPQTAESGTVKNLLDNTKSCYCLFYNYKGTSVNELISYSDTENVTNMSQMFQICSNLTTIPQLDTSNVTNMYSMFDGCVNLTTIPQLDTSNVTNMYSMFYDCRNLTTIPQLNTSNVTSMSNMFYDCYKLTTIDITHMNINGTYKSDCFAYNCYSLTKLIIRNMTTIPTLNSSAFTNCYHFTGTTDPTYNPNGLKDGRIYVPDDKVEALKTATNWSVYADIIVPLSTLVE